MLSYFLLLVHCPVHAEIFLSVCLFFETNMHSFNDNKDKRQVRTPASSLRRHFDHNFLCTEVIAINETRYGTQCVVSEEMHFLSV